MLPRPSTVKMSGNVARCLAKSPYSVVSPCFEPTILESVVRTSRIMNEEPFGPVMMLEPFPEFDSMVAESNRLPYGLAAYVYTRSARTVSRITDAVETGMVSINHRGLGLPEAPFGGVKDSGSGSRRRHRGDGPYLVSKFVTHSLEEE